MELVSPHTKFQITQVSETKVGTIWPTGNIKIIWVLDRVRTVASRSNHTFTHSSRSGHQRGGYTPLHNVMEEVYVMSVSVLISVYEK